MHLSNHDLTRRTNRYLVSWGNFCALRVLALVGYNRRGGMADSPSSPSSEAGGVAVQEESGVEAVWKRAISLGNSALRSLVGDADSSVADSASSSSSIDEDDADVELASKRSKPATRSTWSRVAPAEGEADLAPISRPVVVQSDASVAAEEEKVEVDYSDEKNAVELLMLGGIPGVCCPGRTAKEREVIMNHNRRRVEVVNQLWTDPRPRSCFGRRDFDQGLSTAVDHSGEELQELFVMALVPSGATRAFIFLLYLLTYLVHFVWVCFALPPIVLPINWLVSARARVDAPDWVWWVSLCGSGLRVLNLTSFLGDNKDARDRPKDAWGFSIKSWFGLGWDVLMVLYLKRTDTSIKNWDSDAVGHRVGTFFLVVVGVVMMVVWLLTLFYWRDTFDNETKSNETSIAPKDWDGIKKSARSALRVHDAMPVLKDKASLVQMVECLFRLVDRRKRRHGFMHNSEWVGVEDKYSAVVLLCIDALSHLPENQRNPEFALSTICSFGVTAYDCVSSMCGWYVLDPALAPIEASKTLHDNTPTRLRSPLFKVRKGSRARSEIAYVEPNVETHQDEYPSFETGWERSDERRPYPSSTSGVRVTIPTNPQAFVSNPQHTGLLGLLNTAVAVWFLVHWEFDVYHAFLAPAVLGELWAQLWIVIWWSAGQAPLKAFVDPVHWLIGQRGHLPDNAVRLLAGEATAAVMGVVAALNALKYYAEGSVIGIVAMAVAALLKYHAKDKDIAVVCFLAYLSELILEVAIVVKAGNFTWVRILLGVTAALESMILTIRLLQVLVGRLAVEKRLPVGRTLAKTHCLTRESWFGYAVACGYWGAVFTGYSPTYVMVNSVCSGSVSTDTDAVRLGWKAGYQDQVLHTGARFTSKDEPGWGYVVSTLGGEKTATAWNLPAEKGFIVFEVGSWYGKRYPCL